MATNRYSKAAVAAKRTKAFMQDEVEAEIQIRLQKKEFAKRAALADDLLTREALKTVRSPSMFNVSNKTGEKTRVQQLAEAVPIPEEMPQLPPYLQIFAFRYATEVRRHVDWANIMHVSIYTIRYWLLKPDVMQYILKLRQERQFLMVERIANLERKAYEKLDEILDTAIDGYTIESIRKAVLDTIGLARGGDPQSLREGTVNVNVNANAQAGAVSVSNSTARASTEEIKERIQELEMIEAEVLDEE